MLHQRNDYQNNKKYFLPFWGINDDFNEKNIYFKLRKYSELGIKELITWFNTGFEIEFLSEEFFRRYSNLVSIAKKFNIKLWIYDDYNWPSGTSAGRIVDEYPCYREKYLEYVILDDVSLNDFYVSNEIISAYLIDRENKVINLEGYYKSNCLKYKLKKDERVLIFYIDFFEGKIICASSGAKWARNSAFYIDLLNKEAVDKFIEYNLEPYKLHFGKEFGKTIVGVFTDEPAVLMRFYGMGSVFPEGFAFPWSDVIEKEFLKENGYSLVPNLYKMVIDTRSSKKTRIDFFKIVSSLYISAFHKNISEWCNINNLKLTGHLLYEEEIPQFIASESNYYLNMKCYSIPGIDTLDVQTGVDIDKRDIAPQLAGSLRNIENLKHILCEVFSVTGWKLDFKNIKRITTWLATFGINVIVPTSVANSIKGLRKKLAPPVLNYQPYFTSFKDFINYFSLISYISENSKDISRIGVLYPTLNLWANFKPDPNSRGKDWSDLENFIVKETNSLKRNQISFNYIFEEMVNAEDLYLVDNEIYFKNIILEFLIIPPITHLTEGIASFLKKFLELGGSIVNTSKIRLVKFKNNKNIISCNYDKNFISNLLKLKCISENRIYTLEGFNKNNIYSSIRECSKDILVLFLSNQSLDNDFDGTLVIDRKGTKGLELWKIEEGLFYDVTDFIKINKDKIVLSINLIKNDFLFLVFYKNSESINSLRTKLNLEKAEISNPIIHVFKKNITAHPYYYILRNTTFNNVNKIQFVNRDFWEFSIENNFYAIEKVKIKEDKNYIGKNNGYFKKDFNVEDWKEIRIANIKDFDYTASEGVIEGYFTPNEIDKFSIDFWIRAEFEIKEIPKKIFLVYEDLGFIYEIYINGVIIDNERKKVFSWDDSNRKIDIRDYINNGKNIISILTRTPSWKGHWHANHYVEPIVLIGDFSVKNKIIDKKVNKVRLGSWTEQGFPYFCGTGKYKNKFFINNEIIENLDSGKKLFIEILELGEVAEIYINEKMVKRLLWKPFVVDITNFVISGYNTISIDVSNTLSNLLTGKRNSGIIGNVNLFLV